MRGTTGIDDAGVHLLGRGPQGDRPRPLPPPAPARPAQDGSVVAEEPRLAPPADRRPRRRLLAHGTTPPRRLRRRRPDAAPALQVARPQDGAVAARALR